MGEKRNDFVIGVSEVEVKVTLIFVFLVIAIESGNEPEVTSLVKQILI